jgi:fatty-acid desaturase
VLTSDDTQTRLPSGAIQGVVPAALLLAFWFAVSGVFVWVLVALLIPKSETCVVTKIGACIGTG